MDNIAIVGMGCLYPDYVTKEDFWGKVMAGEAFTSTNMFNGRAIERASIDPKRSDEFFGKYFSQQENELLNTYGDVFKWTTYVCEEALKEAGYQDNLPVLNRTGLVLGIFGMPALEFVPFFETPVQISLEESLRTVLGRDDFVFNPGKPHNLAPRALLADTEPSVYAANRFHLGGPLLNLNAACSSPVYSIKLASMYLLQGKTDMMLAGCHCYNQLNFAVSGMLDLLGLLTSPGENRPFDKKSKGAVGGSGAGMFALKRLEDAIRDKDEILGVIESIGWSNDGGGKAILAPDARGQVIAYKDAYKNGLSPNIDYIECHATGTMAGDWVEIESITEYFRKQGIDPVLSALKGNSGHFFTASTHAAIAKVLMGMKHNTIAQTIKVDQPIDGQVTTQNMPWPQNGPVKRAAVNSFGFGGTNAHMVLREYVQDDKANRIPRKKPAENQKMAVVGLGVHIGEVETTKGFFKHMLENRPIIKPPYKMRWNYPQENPEVLKALGMPGMPKGSYVDEFEFDFLEFKMSALGDEYLLRKDFLLLKTAAEAMIDAGIHKDSHPNTAVLVNGRQDYSELNFSITLEMRERIVDSIRTSWPDMNEAQINEILEILREKERIRETPNSMTGIIPNIRASRIAAHWGFTGPTMSMMNGENGFARSLELAQSMLSQGAVDTAVVGCTELTGELENIYVQRILGNAETIYKNGLSEGAVVVVLKTVEKAEQDGDTIYAVVDGVAISEPSYGPNQQARLARSLSEVIKEGKVGRQEIGYVEMPVMGPDTAKQAVSGLLAEKFEEYLEPADTITDSVERYTGLGFGLTGATAFVKNVLQVSNGVKFEENTSRHYIWSRRGKARRALINTFEEHGPVGHILVSEPVSQRQGRKKLHSSKFILPVVAGDRAELNEKLDALLKNSKKKLGQAYEEAWAAFKARGKDDKVLCLLATDKETLHKEIKAAKRHIGDINQPGYSWESTGGSYLTGNPVGRNAKVVCMCPPGGMFNSSRFFEALETFPEQRGYYLDFVDSQNIAGRQLRGNMLENYLMEMAEVGTGLSILRDKLHLNADYFAGASMGGVSLIFASGSLEAGSKKEYQTMVSELTDTLDYLLQSNTDTSIRPAEMPGQWSSWYIKADKDKLLPLVEQEPDVYVTIIGSPSDVLIAGDADGCQRILDKIGGIAAPVKEPLTIHTPVAKQLYEPSGAKKLGTHINLKKSLPHAIYDGHTGEVIPTTGKNNLVNSLLYVVTEQVNYDKVLENTYRDGGRIYVDVTANPVCGAWADTTLKGKNHLGFSLFPVQHKPEEHYLRVAAKLLSHGAAADGLMDMFDIEVREKPSFVRPVNMSMQQYIEQISATADENWARVAKLGPAPGANTAAAKATEAIPAQPLQATPEATGGQPPVKLADTAPMPAVPAPALQRQIQSIGIQNGLPGGIARRALEARAKAYSLYLQSEGHILDNMIRGLSQGKVLAPPLPVSVSVPAHNAAGAVPGTAPVGLTTGTVLQPEPAAPARNYLWNREEIIEMTSGSMAKVLGPRYAIADQYPVRARLPMPPFMFVDRITKIEGEYGKLEPCSIEIEYDITEDCLFTMGDHVSHIVLTESAQICIFLVAYIGIDEISNGKLRFRIADSNATLHSDLPKMGETFRGVYKINSFLKNGDTTLVTSTYNCYVGDRLVVTLSSIGGFFTEQDLENSKGVVAPPSSDMKPKWAKGGKPTQLHFANRRTSYTDEELADCIAGNFNRYIPDFGADDPRFHDFVQSMLPKVHLVDRVLHVSDQGGKFGLGEIIAQGDIDENHWAFKVHFINDPVFPGSLMLEAVNQIEFFFLMHSGIILKAKKGRVFPLTKRLAKSSFRGQVKPVKSTITYKISVKEVNQLPERFELIFDVDIFWQDINVVRVEGLSVGVE